MVEYDIIYPDGGKDGEGKNWISRNDILDKRK